MPTTWEEQLARLFPGSNTPIMHQEFKAAAKKEIEDWDAKPNIFTVGGVEMEFFSIGQLGRALGNRSPNTLRAWEREGMIPKSPYVKPSQDPRGRRRMYTRDMVEGLVKIAEEEGVLWPHKGLRLSDTKFQERAIALFQALVSRSRRSQGTRGS